VTSCRTHGKFASVARKERQNLPAVFVILLLLKNLLPYLTVKTDTDNGKFWTLFNKPGAFEPI